MRSMTEAQAALNFAAMLDEIERGETVLLTRAGRPFARVTPETTTGADRISDVLKNHPLGNEAIDELEKSIREHREWMDKGMREWPVD